MKETLSKKETPVIIGAGVIIGIIAVALVYFGNPANMGFCIACFLRDTSGALGFHSAAAVQYIRPEIVGLVLGSCILALATKEFKPRGGSAPVTRFVIGMFVMIGCLMFLGCPFRMILRLAGGDLNVLFGLGGFVCGILNTIPHSKNDPPVKRFFLALIRAVVRIYVEIFRGTPMVLQAVFLYYGLPYFTDNAVRFDSIWMAAILVVSINTGAYMAESVRGGIISIDPGQTEGAKAIGMTHVQTMLHVILPQAIRNILPQIGNNFIINVKDTSVMFIIGFPDFFSAHRAAVGASYLYFPSAVVEMAGYLTMTLIASFLLRWLEKRMDGSSDYKLAQTDHLTMAAGTYSHPDRGTPFDERSKEYRDRVRQELQHGRTRGDR